MTTRKKSPYRQPVSRTRPTKANPQKTTVVSAKEPPPSSQKPTRIVGIGASAGGLEAFEQFFRHMPPDSGMAFVIVQHLDPARHSGVPEILARFTTMPIREATGGLKVKPNSIYLIPPNKSMSVRNGALYLEEQPPGLRLPIDFFFRSLAVDRGTEAIAIILSGTGTDGTLGLRAIKGELGTVFVQDPNQARYDGMPRSAVDTGLADFVLQADKMPDQLVQFVRHSAINGERIGKVEAATKEPLEQIFATMKSRTGHDFSRYKKSTVRRRLERRMSVTQIDDIAKYARVLAENDSEVKALLKDILISVTSFFRDPESFEAMKEKLRNEELQSTNEELDTSREELQSLNEELTTLNAELQDKNEQLAKTNDDLKNFLSRTDIAVIFLDMELAIRSFTPASTDIFNIRDIDIGRPLGEITSRLDYPGLAADAREVIRTLKRKETEVQRKDGAWYMMCLLPYLTAHNEISGVVLSFLDISKQKKSEELSKLAAEQWQETFDSIPEMISICDRDYTILKVNAAFAEAFGKAKEELVGKKCHGIFHAGTQWALACPHEQTLKTGKIVREEIFEPTRNAYFDVSTAPIFDTEGSVVSAVHIARDITERKASEQQTLFEARLLDAIEDVIIVVDTERRITHWGKGSANLFGWQPEEVIGHDALGLLVPEDATRQAEAIKKVIKSGQSWAGEFIVKCRGGALATVLFRISPIADAKGKITSVIAVGKDISQLKEVDRLKDEFLGLISHELRTPLTIVTGSLLSAQSQGISAGDARELIQNAIEGADSLASILENMLELSRYQAGRLQLHTESVPIPDVVQVMIEKLKRQGARQQFRTDFPSDLPAVAADPLRVERIVYNLLENATKYSPEESEISISARKRGNLVITEVTDRGSGIAPPDHEKIFELFQQLDTPARARRGVGLGLVVCKRLVEAQGGWIKVDSAVGKGSSFSFALPVPGKKK